MSGAFSSSSSSSCSSPSSQLQQPLLSSEQPSHFSFSHHTHSSPHFAAQQQQQHAFHPLPALSQSPSSFSPTSASSAFSPPPHHASITFPPYPAQSLFPSTLPLLSSSSSLAALAASAPCAPSGSWLKSPSASCTLIAALLCFSLLIAASVLSVLHVGNSSPTLLAALSRFRPHFGQASHLMAAQGAAIMMGPPSSLLEASVIAGQQPDTTAGVGDAVGLHATDDGDISRQLALIASYLERKTAPAAAAASAAAVTAASTSAPFLVTATRFWCQQPSDLQRLSAFISQASRYSDAVLVAVNVEQDKCSIARVLQSASPVLHIIPILPWLSVTAALNTLTLYAARLRAPYILFQSVEIAAAARHVRALLSQLSPSTLCVGLCLPQHSCAEAGEAVITGSNNPWNTFALWHVDSLMRVGFLPVSDSRLDGDDEGQEEGPTISLLQMIAARQRRTQSLQEQQTAVEDRQQAESEAAVVRWEAKLLRLSRGVDWTEVDDAARRAYVERKLSRKRHKFEQQIARLGIERGIVSIIVADDAEEQDSDAAQQRSGNTDNGDAEPLAAAQPLSSRKKASKSLIPIGH